MIAMRKSFFLWRTRPIKSKYRAEKTSLRGKSIFIKDWAREEAGQEFKMVHIH